MTVPFTILTGFLGAGKTTVLNRILGVSQNRRIAVLVNELGRISIDSKLILSKGGDVLELAGGCVCCKVDTKNDLWDGIAEVIERSGPEHVILETTGIAEPAAIMDGFRYLPKEKQRCVDPVGVVSVVDAQAGPRILTEREEAREQILAADRILLSKLDLASPSEVEEVHSVLDELNDEAERASFPEGEGPSQSLTNWLLEKRKRKPHAHTHSHTQGQLIAVAYRDSAPLVGDRILQLVERHRGSLYRIKGFVNLAGEREPHYLELAGNALSLEVKGRWEGPPKTELVIIGDSLDEAAWHRQLWACRASS